MNKEQAKVKDQLLCMLHPEAKQLLIKAWEMLDHPYRSEHIRRGVDFSGELLVLSIALRERDAAKITVGHVSSVVNAQMAAAKAKFPTWPTDPLHALAVLGEEFGELTKAIVQLIYEPRKSSLDHVRTEAAQTAAMALRFLESLDEYDFARSKQHEQTP